MRNLTNTMIAWTPLDRPEYDTVGEIALIPHPWQMGPFPYAKDFGASLRYVCEASLDERKRMLTGIMDRIRADGIDWEKAAAVLSGLEEWVD